MLETSFALSHLVSALPSAIGTATMEISTRVLRPRKASAKPHRTLATIETLPKELILEILSYIDDVKDLQNVANATPDWSSAALSVRFCNPPLALMGRIEKPKRQHCASQIRTLELRTPRDGQYLRSFHGLNLSNVRNLVFDEPKMPRVHQSRHHWINGSRETYDMSSDARGPRPWKATTFAPLYSCVNLERLEIYTWPFAEVDLGHFITKCVSLKHLATRIWRTDKNREWTRISMYKFLMLPGLQSARMDYPLLRLDTPELLRIFPDDLINIKSFRCETVYDDHFSAFVHKLVNVESLEITAHLQDRTSWMGTFAGLPKLKNLSLIINNRTAHEASYQQFLDFLGCQHIQRLAKLQIACEDIAPYHSRRMGRGFVFPNVLPNLVDLRLKMLGVNACSLETIGLFCPRLQTLMINSGSLKLMRLRNSSFPLFPNVVKLCLSTFELTTSQMQKHSALDDQSSTTYLTKCALPIARLILEHAPRLAETKHFVTSTDEYDHQVFLHFRQLVGDGEELVRDGETKNHRPTSSTLHNVADVNSHWVDRTIVD